MNICETCKERFFDGICSTLSTSAGFVIRPTPRSNCPEYNPKEKEEMNDNAKKWWFVFNPYETKCPTVRHDTFLSAKNEAERVCNITGKKVHVLECIGTFHPPCGPIWKNREAAE